MNDGDDHGHLLLAQMPLDEVEDVIADGTAVDRNDDEDNQDGAAQGNTAMDVLCL